MNDQSRRSNETPVPVAPQQRQEPLPWNRPKPEQEDKDAPERVKVLLDSPGYRRADQDLSYLDLYETRGVRLQIDYQKAELVLQQHGIRQTLVVFGGTRIPEPAAAQLKVTTLHEQLLTQPRDQSLRRRLKVAERVLAKSKYYDVARAFSRLVSLAGQQLRDGPLVIMTGGGPGIMEAANRGAYDVDAKTVGLNIDLPHEQYPNPYITPGLCFRFHYFALRKLHFMLRTRALVAFPGGYGTMDELFETLTLVQTRKIAPVPIVLVGESYWRQAVNIEFMIEEGVIDEEDRELFCYAETAQEIWDCILQWHRDSGSALLN